VAVFVSVAINADSLSEQTLQRYLKVAERFNLHLPRSDGEVRGDAATLPGDAA
jgi:hypothetical protein